MERFGKMTLKIKNLSLEVTLHHLVTALKPGPFSDNLCKKPATNLEELRRRATKFMELEELKEFRKQLRDETTQKKPSHNLRNDRTRFHQPSTKIGDLARKPKFDQYTPLNIDRSRILAEALNTNLLAQPRKALRPPNADPDKYCKYHNNHGHTTEECVNLKNKIEELIQAGHLCQYVH